MTVFVNPYAVKAIFHGGPLEIPVTCTPPESTGKKTVAGGVVNEILVGKVVVVPMVDPQITLMLYCVLFKMSTSYPLSCPGHVSGLT